MAWRALCLAAAGMLAAAEKPNFVVFYADDMGYGDLGCYGHPMSDTPNVDKLASEGMRFANMYTASPVCSPSRAGLLTGRYQTRSGIWPGVFSQQSSGGLPAYEVTFASLLKEAGYKTAMVGKWHLGVGSDWQYIPTKHGFDSWMGIPYSHDMPDPNLCFYDPSGTPGLPCFPGTNPEPMYTTTPIYDEDLKQVRLSADDSVQIPLFNGTAANMQIISQPANLTILDDLYNDAAVGFVREAARGGQPFLLYYAFQHTHHPDYSGRMFWNTTMRGMFGDSIKALDWSLGNVLGAVKEAGIEDNTFVFFSSDNGPSLMRLQRGGSAGLLRCGKGTTWEGGQRVPGIVKWPNRVAPGTFTREIASTMDLFATMLKIVGVTPPGDRVYDAVDMSPFLFSADGKAPPGSDVRDYYFYWDETVSSPADLNAIRWREWKVHYKTKGSHCPNDYFVPTCRSNYSSGVLDTPLLFNLHHDDGEHVPLDITDPMYKYIVDHINMIKQQLLASPGLFGSSMITAENLMDQPCCYNQTCKAANDPAKLPQCCRTNPY